MACIRILAVYSFFLSIVGSAFAAGRNSGGSSADPGAAAAREAKERAAKKACLNGDPVEGVELLTDLFVDSNDATYIFNQGRCYEQNDRCEDAIVRFREYLRKIAGASESERADVEKHIADCEALLAKKSTEGTPPVAAVARGASPAAPAQSFGTPPAEIVAQPRAERSGGGLRVAGLATMAGGGAVLITGLVLNLKHNGMIHDIKAEYRGDTADSAQTYKTLSMVGYGVGAACLLGGATLYWLGYRAGDTAVVPAVVAGNAGLLLAGGF
jgi:hypothetical protein